MRPSIILLSLFILSTISHIKCSLISNPEPNEQPFLVFLDPPQAVAVESESEPEVLVPEVRYLNLLGFDTHFGFCQNYYCGSPGDKNTIWAGDIKNNEYSDYKPVHFHGYVIIISPVQEIPRIEFPGSKTHVRKYTCTATDPGSLEYQVDCVED